MLMGTPFQVCKNLDVKFVTCDKENTIKFQEKTIFGESEYDKPTKGNGNKSKHFFFISYPE